MIVVGSGAVGVCRVALDEEDEDDTEEHDIDEHGDVGEQGESHQPQFSHLGVDGEVGKDAARGAVHKRALRTFRAIHRTPTATFLIFVPFVHVVELRRGEEQLAAKGTCRRLVFQAFLDTPLDKTVYMNNILVVAAKHGDGVFRRVHSLIANPTPTVCLEEQAALGLVGSLVSRRMPCRMS